MQLFVDNLTNVDFSFLDPVRGLLGETWLAHIVLDGALDEQGMVCDFGTVKKVMRQWLDDEVDHRLVVPVQSPNITLYEVGDTIDLTWHYGSSDNPKQLRCKSPRQAICLVDTDVLTPSSVAHWCIQQLMPHFPNTVEQLQLDFTTEAIIGSHYHYSHGLKKHAGNCQRIAHGHRSTINVWRNGQTAPAQEAEWAERWCDIYIGSREDLIETRELAGVPCHHFAYEAAQGAFELTIAEDDCYLMNTDSTVEWIAQHIANELKRSYPKDDWTVKAFEGIGKGAIAKSS